MIRQLKPGEPIPKGEPRRYRNASGYIRLRWRIAPKEFVECYEHRFLTGFASQHVHHINRDRSDNRPENLMPVSTIQHGAEHRAWDLNEAALLYRSGWSLPQLARRYGRDSSNILRTLRRHGVQLRTLSESWIHRKATYGPSGGRHLKKHGQHL